MTNSVPLRSLRFTLPLIAVFSVAFASQPAPPTQLCIGNECADDLPGGSYQFPDIPTSPSAASLKAVSTFHNAGLYWGEPTGSGSNEALVRFRKVGTPNWRQGHALWFDAREASSISYGSQEYRGSIVGL